MKAIAMLDVPDRYKKQWVIEAPHCPLTDTVVSALVAFWWIAGLPAALFAAGYFGVPYLAGLVGIESAVTPMTSGAVVLFAYSLWPAIRRRVRRIGQNAS
ncbi:MAG: hypothetical protein HZA92_19890 [Verrucomicrobia bacterium]|nr:hypothetical protein [Verrucomicrobiota bacterium]